MMHATRYTRLLVIVLVTLFAAAGCGDDDPEDPDHAHEEHGAEEEACEHLQGGPFEMVSAGADAASATDVTFEHTAVTIALDGGEGFVSYGAAMDGEMHIFLSEDVPVTVTSATDGTEIEAEEQSTGSDHCSDIAAGRVYDVSVGTWIIAVGPGAPAEVTVVVELGEGHEEE